MIPSSPLLPSMWRPRRVLLFRALNLGDMLCAVPAWRALRRAWPDAHITLAALPWAADLVRRLPGVLDAHLPFPGYPALPEQGTDCRAWPGFLNRVQRASFDLVVQMHGTGHHTNPLMALFGARVVAGFCEVGEPSRWRLPWPQRGPEPVRLLALAAHLGAPPESPALDFPLREDDWSAWAPLPHVAALRGQRYVCVHAGGRLPAKRWPATHFAAVADQLARRTGLPIVLTGGHEEAGLTAAVARAMRHAAIDAAAAVPAGSLAALIGGASLLLTNDTGVSHVAAALRVPSVVIFRCTDVERWAPIDRERHRVVWDPEGERTAEVLAQAEEILGMQAALS